MKRGKRPIRTIHDIAREAGVSATTVSFVLNNKGSINEKTRERVLAIVERSNYEPSKIARQLRKRVSNSFGVIIDHFHNRFFNSVFDGINSVTDPRGYSFLVAESRENVEKEQQEANLLLEHGVDGLILFPCSNDHEYLVASHEKYEVPVVLIGNTYPDYQFPSVTADNLQGARLAARKLISLGREPILHIAGPPSQSMCRLRREGFEQIMRDEGGISDPSTYVFETTDLSIGEGFQVMEQIAESFVPPYSIFVVNDDTAMGVIKYCHRRGLRIPEDVALIGFSDIDLIDELDLGLSSIHIPAVEMGVRASELLIECAEEGLTSCREANIQLPVTLAERRSTSV
jgi:LacI family transcriptional regulator